MNGINKVNELYKIKEINEGIKILILLCLRRSIRGIFYIIIKSLEELNILNNLKIFTVHLQVHLRIMLLGYNIEEFTKISKNYTQNFITLFIKNQL